MSKSSKIKWKRTEFFIESKVRVPILGQIVEISIDPEPETANLPSPAQIRSLEAFLALSPDQKNGWAHQIALDCYYTCLGYKIDGETPPVRLRKRANVWRHLRLRQVFVPQHGNTQDRYVFIQGGCDWEEEHGLELLFKNERLFRVGPQEGLAQNEEWFNYFISE